MSTFSRFNSFVSISSLSLALTAALLISAPLAHAGATKAGDGGHGAVCRKGKFEKVYLLERLEAEKLYGFNLSFGAHTSPHPVEGWRNYYFIFDAFKVARARAGAALMDRSHPFLKILALTDRIFIERREQEPEQTGDIGPARIVLPASCRLVQIGRSYERGDELHVEFGPRSFDRLGAREQAALVLHEALHRWFGHQENTLAVREAVIYLSSPLEFRQRNREAFVSLVESKRPQSFR